MPNQIHPDKQKLVILEYRETREVLELIAKRQRCSLSDIVRQATQDFAEKHADTAELQRILDAKEKDKARSKKRTGLK